MYQSNIFSFYLHFLWLEVFGFFMLQYQQIICWDVTKIGTIISSFKISWAVLVNTWTKVFMKLLQSQQNMNQMSVKNVPRCTWQWRWKKFRMTLTAMTKLWFQSKCYYSWKLYWFLVPMFQLPGSVLAYGIEDC